MADGFEHQYPSVRRFVAKLRGTSPLPFRRMECEAGEEAQIDFGTGAWIELPDGKRRRSHVFRIVLSFSRKGYSEAVSRQTTEDFIRSIENAFWHVGGVPKVLVMKDMIDAVGPYTLRFEQDRFGLLVRSIISQQISTRAARAIRRRLVQLVGPGGLTLVT